MRNVADFVSLESMEQFEFGLALDIGVGDFPVIRVVVVDHEQFIVRTLGLALALEDAFSMSRDCIQKGFYVDGLLFTGIPDYSFSTLIGNSNT